MFFHNLPQTNVVEDDDEVIVQRNGVTSRAPVTVFTGPQGPPGEDGEQGPPGADGDPGPLLAGTCSLEQFGATGNNVTLDTAAYDAAVAAYNAGTYGTLLLGAKTYLVESTVVHPIGFSVIGFGPKSVLKTTQARAIILMYDSNATNRKKSTLFAYFRMEGTATGSLGVNAPANQNGIEVGYLSADGAARVMFVSVEGYRLDRAFSFAEPDEVSAGARGINCLAEECKYGLYAANAGDWSNCQAIRCNNGIRANSNSQFRNWTLELCNIGVDVIAGGNDGHGVFSGRLVHCTMPIRSAGALLNGFLFDSIELFEGEISIANGNTGAVIFSGGQIDATTYTLLGKSRWLDNTFDTAYFTSLDTTGGEAEFSHPRHRDGTIPAWIETLLRVPYTFPADTNQTLSSQQAWADIVAIQAGVVTATRDLTNPRTPKRGDRQLVKNGTAQTINVKWATGGSVAIAAGLSAIIGFDGTNAVKELAEGGGGGSSAGSSGDIQFAGTAGAFAANSGLHWYNTRQSLIAGLNCTALGDQSCAMGNDAHADGAICNAFGLDIHANQVYDFAGGAHIVCNDVAQVALGENLTLNTGASNACAIGFQITIGANATYSMVYGQYSGVDAGVVAGLALGLNSYARIHGELAHSSGCVHGHGYRGIDVSRALNGVPGKLLTNQLTGLLLTAGQVCSIEVNLIAVKSGGTVRAYERLVINLFNTNLGVITIDAIHRYPSFPLGVEEGLAANGWGLDILAVGTELQLIPDPGADNVTFMARVEIKPQMGVP